MRRNYKHIKEHTRISRESLVTMIKKDKPDYKESSVRWALYRLVHDGVITKVDAEFFRIGRVKSYTPIREEV